MGNPVNLDPVLQCLRRYRYRYANEKDLQAGIESALLAGGFAFEREVRLAPGDVADFMVEPGICVEIKIDGGISALTRQLHRYAQHDAVQGIVLVTSRSRLTNLPEVLNAKPLLCFIILGALG